jgi:putative ubiquitin-RnfH superfamily antitoxin RatB of RatAB toxin-antitoxin module
VSAAAITVTVVWATPSVQDIVSLCLPAGATAAEALARSGLVVRHAIDVSATRLGIHGRRAGADTVLADGDRLDICRALVADPKDARRARAGAAPQAIRPRRGGG